jgi:hypothetical protein
VLLWLDYINVCPMAICKTLANIPAPTQPTPHTYGHTNKTGGS